MSTEIHWFPYKMKKKTLKAAIQISFIVIMSQQFSSQRTISSQHTIQIFLPNQMVNFL